MVAIEESASIACALVVRGISSTAKAVTLRSTRGASSAGSSSGRRKAIKAAPCFIRRRSSAGGRFTAASTSAEESRASRSLEISTPAGLEYHRLEAGEKSLRQLLNRMG